jgi:glycosyltransferase involved in cell wall biosynthesis
VWIFTGSAPKPEAPAYLALGDAAAAPKLSSTEGAGKLLNYMAVGLPTVAFDTPVAREYLGSHGVFAVTGDAENLAMHLLTCLFPPINASDGQHNIGQKLRERAIQQYSWERAGCQIVQTYQYLLGDAAPPVDYPPYTGDDPAAAETVVAL